MEMGLVGVKKLKEKPTNDGLLKTEKKRLWREPRDGERACTPSFLACRSLSRPCFACL